ncbi:hypothetical protein ACFQV4_27835 [Streptomyces thermocarboxydus]
MSAAEGDVAGAGGSKTARGRTRWGVVTAILGFRRWPWAPSC